MRATVFIEHLAPCWSVHVLKPAQLLLCNDVKHDCTKCVNLFISETLSTAII